MSEALVRDAGSGRLWNLRRKMTLGLMGYVLLLTLGVLANDFIVNESAEKLAWESLLKAELDHFRQRREADPDYQWPETQTLELLTMDRSSQDPLLALTPGVHDEVRIGGREKVLLVEDAGEQRFIIALDISDLESREARLRRLILLSALIVTVLLGCAAAWGTGRLLRPLRELSERIGALDPARGVEHVSLPSGSSAELARIAQSVNHYIDRNTAFVKREQAFVGVASHELRTPMAIIAGAAGLALDEPGVPEAARKRMLRIKEAAGDVNELVTLLLALAKDPARLADSRESIPLHTLLPQLVRDHAHLASGKQISVVVGELPECEVHAPLQLVKSAIGNLLRNAIENVHEGEVLVELRADGVVTIEDQGPGIAPERISELYTLQARGEGLDGGGIGLQLIARLCEHLGWTLQVDSGPGDGTRMALHLPR